MQLSGAPSRTLVSFRSRLFAFQEHRGVNAFSGWETSAVLILFFFSFLSNLNNGKHGPEDQVVANAFGS